MENDNQEFELMDQTAKKDFIICRNDYYREIKEGDDLSDIPLMYYANLKTEKVI